MKLFKFPSTSFFNTPTSQNHPNFIMKRTICGSSLENLPQPHRIVRDKSGDYVLKAKLDFLEPSMLGIKPEPPEWPEREELIRASIERRASSVEIPLSLRIIKKRQKLQEGFHRDTCDSIKKVHSSMVFIILELQRYALKMRQSLSDDNFEGIIAHIHREMNDSFVWLFGQIFPQSPNMMICLMTLLADFSVYSLAMENSKIQKEVDSPIGQSISRISNVDKDIFFLGSDSNSISNNDTTSVRKGVLGESSPGKAIQDMSPSVVSSGLLEHEQDNYVDYHRTDLKYQTNISQDPNNSLLLCNYAQFLHLVARDYDRAEECFKRAIQVIPNDAEALNRYANFLWVVRMDVQGAEQKYLEAIDIESENSYYSSSYASFLWSSGGEETCYPL